MRSIQQARRNRSGVRHNVDQTVSMIMYGLDKVQRFAGLSDIQLAHKQAWARDKADAKEFADTPGGDV